MATDKHSSQANGPFRVNKSRAVRIVTACSWTVVVAVFAPSVWLGLKTPQALVVVLPVVALVAGVMSYYYALSPQRVELTDEALVVQRRTGRVKLCYADITDVGLWKGKVESLWRVWGSGGFCGFIGWFSGGGLKRHYEYVGEYAEAFYVSMRNGRTYLLSCEKAEQVVGLCRGLTQRLASETVTDGKYDPKARA